MAVMLIILIPLAVVFARALILDLKRPRRHALGPDVESEVRAAKASDDAKAVINAAP